MSNEIKQPKPKYTLDFKKDTAQLVLKKDALGNEQQII